MNKPDNLPDHLQTNSPQHSPAEKADELMPTWAKWMLAAVALLLMLGYASPDMRAVYVAAWAACF